MKLLDCFCGMGGASEGFHREGFECTGIDIVDVGYPYKLILQDMRELDGRDFQGYDVIWGSPPCRDFSRFAKIYGTTWKNPPNPKNGLKLVQCFLNFVSQAKPRFWIMENVSGLREHLSLPCRFKSNLRSGSQVKQKKQQMVRTFWGNFPNFLLPKENSNIIMDKYTRKSSRKKAYQRIRLSTSEKRAKIPLACSLAFARACKRQLLEASIK